MSATVLYGMAASYSNVHSMQKLIQASMIRVVFVIMVISSLAFYAMAFRVPVVCCPP